MWHRFPGKNFCTPDFLMIAEVDVVILLRPGDCVAAAVPRPRAAGHPVPRVLLLHVAQGQGGRGLSRHQVLPDPGQHRPQHPGQQRTRLFTCLFR